MDVDWINKNYAWVSRDRVIYGFIQPDSQYPGTYKVTGRDKNGVAVSQVGFGTPHGAELFCLEDASWMVTFLSQEELQAFTDSIRVPEPEPAPVDEDLDDKQFLYLREILRGMSTAVADLCAEKNIAYGSSFHVSGDFLRLLYPNGVKAAEYQKMLTLARIFDKLMRIAHDEDALAEDPWSDIIGYCLLSKASRQGVFDS